MENLWTPWRFHYISSQHSKQECVFCQIRDDGPDRDPENLVLLRRPPVFVILNRFPYTSGHLLVVTNRHIPALTDTHEDELLEMSRLARTSEQVLKDVYGPDGFNIGFNLGECAGAGVAGHLHLHVVPRWCGDSNLVAVLSQTRIIPEELPVTYEKLLPGFQNR